MKKIVLLLICVLCLMLSACGETKTETVVENKTSNTSALPGADLKDVEETKNEKYDLANTFVDKSADDLIAAIGEPASREYTSSCLGDGEDGNLDYGDFWVNTYKENDNEVVKSVNLK